ncbi:MAG: hypothetical protein KDJ52_07190 [Anaerolineae bacterium]|nr:hypothetical protein [Anaerolineae bacterium]
MKAKTTTQKTSLKIKTGLKAGYHCRDAFQYHLRDPYNNGKIKDFVDCCQGDNKCLQ